MNTTTKFDSDNRGTIACIHCGRLTWEKYSRTRGVNGETCGDCADEFQAENEHNDYGNHELYASLGYERICPICHPEHRERRLERVRQHNAKLQINIENRTREARERANAKAAVQAAKDAATKFCKAPQCNYGSNDKPARASKTSDYCTYHRDSFPHEYKRGGKRLAEAVAHVQPQYRRYPDIDPAELCDTCGNPFGHELHQKGQE